MKKYRSTLFPKLLKAFECEATIMNAFEQFYTFDGNRIIFFYSEFDKYPICVTSHPKGIIYRGHSIREGFKAFFNEVYS